MNHKRTKNTVVRRGDGTVKKLAGKAYKSFHKGFMNAFNTYDKSVQGQTGTRSAQ